MLHIAYEWIRHGIGDFCFTANSIHVNRTLTARFSLKHLRWPLAARPDHLSGPKEPFGVAGDPGDMFHGWFDEKPMVFDATFIGDLNEFNGSYYNLVFRQNLFPTNPWAREKTHYDYNPMGFRFALWKNSEFAIEIVDHSPTWRCPEIGVPPMETITVLRLAQAKWSVYDFPKNRLWLRLWNV